MAISLPPIGALQSRGFAAEPTKARGQVLAAGAPRVPHNDGRGLAGLGQGLAAIGDTIKQSRQQERKNALIDSVFGPSMDERNAAMTASGGPSNQAAQAMSGNTVQRLVSKGVPQNIAEIAGKAFDMGDRDTAWEAAGKYLMAGPDSLKASDLVEVQTADGPRFMTAQQALGQTPAAEAQDSYNILSPQEAASLGLPTGKGQTYQRKSNGQITAVGGGGVTVNTGTPYNPMAAADETYGKINTSELTNIPAALNQVNENATAYSQLEEAINNNAIQGPFAESRLLLGSIGQMIGVPNLAETVSSTEQMRAITNRLAPGLRPEGSGPMSDADLKLFLNSLPNIGITENGNRKILGYLKKINNYQRQVLRAKREFLSKRENFGASPYELSEHVNQKVQSPFTTADRDFFSSLSGGTGADTLGNTQIQTPGLESRGQMGGRPTKDWSQADDEDLKKELGLQ